MIQFEIINSDDPKAGLGPNDKITPILARMVEEHGHYVDPSFRRELKSICDEEKHQLINVFSNSIWLRPHEIFSAPYENI